jgi:hypothetical protein
LDDYEYVTISAVEANNIDVLKFLGEEKILNEKALIRTALAYNNIIKNFFDILNINQLDKLIYELIYDFEVDNL